MKQKMTCLMLLFFPFIDLQCAIKVLAFSGSTRSESYNQSLVEKASNIAKESGAEVSVVNLKDYQMPFYQADLESSQGMPINARRFRQLLLAHDKIMIATPEYNGSVTAILKNALDWASRSEKGGVFSGGV